MSSTVIYKKTQSNRVSNIRDFVCSLFPEAIPFYFYVTLLSPYSARSNSNLALELLKMRRNDPK